MSSLKLGDAPKPKGVLAPAGNHVARCIAVIDLGTHTENTTFGEKTNRKLRFSWELPDETHVFDEKKGAQPFTVHKSYNFFVSEKASLRKDLESWRGRPFTEDEISNFELADVVGATCMLNVVHTTKGDKTYANIASITPLPKSLKGSVPDASNPLVFYTITQGKDHAFESLPPFLKEQIAKCHEWQSKSPSADAKDDPFDMGGEDDGSEIPF